MKKLVGFLLVFCASLSLYASKIDTLVVHSTTMNKDIKNVVITPDSYKKNGPDLPVVYLLHGAGGDHKAWLGKAPKIEAYADLYNVIIVCPDGHKTSWYFDSPKESNMQYETYISKDELLLLAKPLEKNSYGKYLIQRANEDQLLFK